MAWFGRPATRSEVILIAALFSFLALLVVAMTDARRATVETRTATWIRPMHDGGLAFVYVTDMGNGMIEVHDGERSETFHTPWRSR